MLALETNERVLQESFFFYFTHWVLLISIPVRTNDMAVCTVSLPAACADSLTVRDFSTVCMEGTTTKLADFRDGSLNWDRTFVSPFLINADDVIVIRQFWFFLHGLPGIYTILHQCCQFVEIVVLHNKLRSGLNKIAWNEWAYTFASAFTSQIENKHTKPVRMLMVCLVEIVW